MIAIMITIQLLFGAFFVFIFSIRVLKAIFDPARNIPGPIWCRFSRFWLLKTMLKGRPHEDIARLHTKHGKQTLLFFSVHFTFQRIQIHILMIVSITSILMLKYFARKYCENSPGDV